MNRIKNEIYRFIEMFFSLIPGSLGFALRKYFYVNLFNSCGNGFSIGVLSRIQQPQAISLGNHVRFNDFAWIAANDKGGQIEIGDNTIIGPRVILHTGNHIYRDLNIPIIKQGYEFKPIIIKENVWLGGNVTVLQGVTINRGAIVAAGSVVTKNVDEFCIVGGIPSKVIGKRHE